MLKSSIRTPSKGFINMSLSRSFKRAQERKNCKADKALVNKLKRLNLSDFDYKADDPNLTFSAMGSQLVDFLKVIGLTGMFEQHVDLNKRQSVYNPSDLSQLLVLLNVLGIDRIENCRTLNADRVLLKKLGLERIPDPQTLRDELARYGQKNLKGLFLVNQRMLDIFKTLAKPQEVDLHFDAKVITVFGDQEQAEVGYTPRYPGRKSYHLKVCVVEPFGFVLAIHLQAGTAVSNTEFVDFYQRCTAAVPQQHFVIRTVRVDSGFFSDETIRAFEADYIFFEVVAKKNPDLKKFITTMIPDKDFGPFNESGTIAGASFLYQPKNWGNARQFVVVRKREEPKVGQQEDIFTRFRYQVICHNQEDMTAKEAWQDYNQRGRCELNIRDLDYDHFISKVPTGDFESNFAWFWHCVFAHNLMVIFRLFALPAEWAKARTSTLRKKLINVPGRLVNLGGRMTMRMMEGFPHIEVFTYVKERLRWLFWELNPLPV